MKITRSIWVVAALAVILIGARLLLLRYLTRHVNNALASVQGYTCKVDDVDLYLYRGAFQLQDVQINKTGVQIDIPLLYASAIDISIDWNALLDEAFVSDITFERVRLNFIEGEKSDQYGTGVDWAMVLKELSPLSVNRVVIVDSKFTYYDLNVESRHELAFYNWNGAIENLCQIADSTSALPSMAYFTASSSDSSVLNMKMKFNAHKAVPDLDITFAFENIDLQILNGFFKTYSQKTVEHGKLDLYTNLALLDGKVEGYIKYEATHLKMTDSNDGKPDASKAWQAIGVFLASNQDKEKFATRVPLAGTLQESHPAIWAELWQFYSKEFLKAFEQRKREGTIKLNTVTNEDTALTRKMEKQLKKEQRKERRKKKREERKKQKDS
jgi:hypothetical protein